MIRHFCLDERSRGASIPRRALSAQGYRSATARECVTDREGVRVLPGAYTRCGSGESRVFWL